MEESESKSSIGFGALVLMILSTIFGFANSTVAFDQMGYASIIWYILAAIFVFLPTSLMYAEYGSSLKEAKGGIYSWLEAAVGEKIAFIGTFIWLSSWVVWMTSTASKVWIPFTSMLFGHDMTQSIGFAGLSSTSVVGLLGIAWIIFVTWMSARGIQGISKVATVGGVFTMLLNAVFLVISIIVLILQHGKLMQPITGMGSFIHSPNADFQTPVAVISFMIYAIFAYGGMESISGVIDNVKKPERTFPFAVVTSMVIMAVSYALMIFMWGISTNWNQVLGKGEVNLGNITYVLMNNLGVTLGDTMGLSHATSIVIGSWLTRFTGLSMWLGYVGAFFVLIYSPIKSFMLGSDERLWPKKMTKLNEHGMPAYAMWVQAAIVCVIIFAISFGGSAAKEFYLILTNMSNVSTTAPYLFLVGAFPFFKKQPNLDRPFVIFKSQWMTNLVSVIVFLVLAAGIVFTCLQPFLEGDYVTFFWTLIGPIFFGIVAWLFYHVKASK